MHIVGAGIHSYNVHGPSSSLQMRHPGWYDSNLTSDTLRGGRVMMMMMTTATAKTFTRTRLTLLLRQKPLRAEASAGRSVNLISCTNMVHHDAGS